jgi:redox-sensitive bicupin YhaK (pirin superfamily)
MTEGSNMFEIRRAGDRGRANFGWLNSRHTFSFGHYYDPSHMGFGSLRVINEDTVKPGAGFGTHGHRDMEIISYVLEGALEHRDSLGNGSVIRPGDVQRMTAGTGIRHSEFNPSDEDDVHFLQIWILPAESGLEPGYEQHTFNDEEKRNRLRQVVSPDGQDGSLKIHQDVHIYAAALNEDASVTYPLRRGRTSWIQVARGRVRVNGQNLQQGDGAAIADLQEVMITGRGAGAEILLFDLG